MVRKEEREDNCTGVASVMIVTRGSKLPGFASHLCRTLSKIRTGKKKKREMVEERAQTAEGRIFLKKAPNIFHAQNQTKLLSARESGRLLPLQSHIRKQEPRCDASAIYSGSLSTQNTANSR